jgi:hypothetical protein
MNKRVSVDLVLPPFLDINQVRQIKLPIVVDKYSVVVVMFLVIIEKL